MKNKNHKICEDCGKKIYYDEELKGYPHFCISQQNKKKLIKEINQLERYLK